MVKQLKSYRRFSLRLAVHSVIVLDLFLQVMNTKCQMSTMSITWESQRIETKDCWLNLWHPYLIWRVCELSGRWYFLILHLVKFISRYQFCYFWFCSNDTSSCHDRFTQQDYVYGHTNSSLVLDIPSSAINAPFTLLQSCSFFLVSSQCFLI